MGDIIWGGEKHAQVEALQDMPKLLWGAASELSSMSGWLLDLY